MNRHEEEAHRNPAWGAYYYPSHSGRRARLARAERLWATAYAAVMRMIRGREA